LLRQITLALKRLREEQGLSQGALAKLAGVTRPAISHIENSKRRPTLMVSLKIAHALGLELSEVIHTAEIALKNQSSNLKNS